MRSDGNDDAPETLPVGPSASDPTRTAEPLGPPRPPLASADPIPATRLRDPDRYQILGEHGRGGLGRVSRVHDRDLGRDIAIKELISRGHVSELRFLREALITARLEHPGIVPVYEAGRWPDGTPFYAMKLVAGRSLRALIGERRTVEDRLGLLHHVIAVADAIAYAHRRNIIHRDLKPANVIIGDFGETIVIDWGLAKDLSTTEESAADSAPFRSQRDDGLTSTGSVLGTPAYMAPEQERGGSVDQRADVFAIGAMLWELCSLERLPPSYSDRRGRMLRRAGIDPDLTAIIVKALEPDPKRRYADAGALAADLKAFKAGARIAARRYSLFALLAHWTRRHRALALSVIAATAVGTLGIAVYVRHIAAERDRVRAASNALVLEHARLLLHSDPTAADEILRQYDDVDTRRRDLLRAEARGIGLARLRAKPHDQTIYAAYPVGSDSVVTIGADGIVAKTSLLGATRVIAHSVPLNFLFAYAARRHLLAFPCVPTTICLLDVQTEQPRGLPADIASFAPAAVALSPSGELLAAVSGQGDLAIWQPGERGSPTSRLRMHLDHSESLRFLDEQTLAMQSSDRIRILHLDTTRWSAIATEFPVPDASGLTADADLHLVAVSTAIGDLVIIDAKADQVVLRPSVCKGQLTSAVIMPVRGAIGFACEDGDTGVWDLHRQSSAIVAHIDGGVSVVAASTDGRYFFAGGNNGTVIVHDFVTQISHSDLGHTTRVSALHEPSLELPGIVTGDAGGQLRVWPLPDASTRVSVEMAARTFRGLGMLDDGSMVAVGNSAKVSWHTSTGASTELPGHTPAHSQIVVSLARRQTVMYGLDDELELWSFDNEPARRVVRTGHGTPGAVLFTARGTLVTACHDGAVVEWSDNGVPVRTLGSIHEPASLARRARHTESVVVGGQSGALWLFDRGGSRYLGTHHDPIVSVDVSPDARWLAIASPLGLISLYDTSRLTVSTIHGPKASSQVVAFSPDSTALAFATDETISIVRLPGQTAGSDDHRSWAWGDVEVAVEYLVFSPDNEWLAGPSDHGGIWLNRRGSSSWIYLSNGTTKNLFGQFSRDGRQLFVGDAHGRALAIDMQAELFH